MLPFEWNYRRIVRKTYPSADSIVTWPKWDSCVYHISDNGRHYGIKLSFQYKNSKAAWREVAERLNNRPKMDGSFGFQLVGV